MMPRDGPIWIVWAIRGPDPLREVQDPSHVRAVSGFNPARAVRG